jgi:hypothetical protein
MRKKKGTLLYRRMRCSRTRLKKSTNVGGDRSHTPFISPCFTLLYFLRRMRTICFFYHLVGHKHFVLSAKEENRVETFRNSEIM